MIAELFERAVSVSAHFVTDRSKNKHERIIDLKIGMQGRIARARPSIPPHPTSDTYASTSTTGPHPSTSRLQRSLSIFQTSIHPKKSQTADEKLSVRFGNSLKLVLLLDGVRVG